MLCLYWPYSCRGVLGTISLQRLVYVNPNVQMPHLYPQGSKAHIPLAAARGSLAAVAASAAAAANAAAVSSCFTEYMLSLNWIC